jgi:ferredoxin
MIDIDINKCNACGFCESVCPIEAITVGRDCARIDASLCTGCGSCVEACPNNAIKEHIPQRVAATAPTGASNQGKEVKDMYGRGMIGFGRGLGRGFGYGMGKCYGRGMGFGKGFGFGRGWFGGVWGRGRPYSYCRFAPRVLRRCWAGPNTGYYEAPYNNPYGNRG